MVTYLFLDKPRKRNYPVPLPRGVSAILLKLQYYNMDLFSPSFMSV